MIEITKDKKTIRLVDSVRSVIQSYKVNIFTNLSPIQTVKRKRLLETTVSKL
ncbi:hypothetical protein [Bacteroides cellulosilyticus]|uniref:hypothetical protein n=1 Tax=Bacteroides cellulosilyticus TaxID=246787 RepID=UPI0035658710